MIKTFKELKELDGIVAGLYQRVEGLQQTKFGYAYKRFVEKNFLPIAKEHDEEIGIVRIDHALEDEKTKEIINDPANFRGFKYTKEGLKKVKESENKIQEKYDKKEIEITPFLSAYIPDTLTEEEQEVLTGLVI